jgi:hypothetical protein
VDVPYGHFILPFMRIFEYKFDDDGYSNLDWLHEAIKCLHLTSKHVQVPLLLAQLEPFLRLWLLSRVPTQPRGSILAAKPLRQGQRLGFWDEGPRAALTYIVRCQHRHSCI